MAQYVHDGTQQADPFNYTADWAVGPAPFTGFDENSMSSPAILNTNDSSLLGNFFRDPDGFPMVGSFDSWLGNEPNVKMDGGGLDPGHMTGFDAISQNVHGPTNALGHQTVPTYLVHSHQQQQHVPVAAHTSMHSQHSTNQTPYEDANAVSAAYGLQQMQMVGQHRTPRAHATSQHMSGMVGAGNWIGDQTGYQIMAGHGQQGTQDNLQSPITSSGRQSANSYHNSQPSANPLNPNYLAQDHWATAMHSSQQPMMANAQQHAHQTNPYNIFPEHRVHSAQPGLPHAYHIQRPTTLNFNSDNNFHGARYEAPRSSIPREDEKGANLNNVPFAQMLAAEPQPQLSHAHPFTPPHTAHAQHRRSLPMTSNFTNAQSSPNRLGGLPSSPPASNSYYRTHSTTEMPTRSIELAEYSDDDVGFEESQPRKRRKSERDEDADYTPTGHVKTPNPKRGSKAAKASDDFDGDYTDTTHTMPTSKSRSSKRRKMSGSGRASPGSQEYSTPRDQSETSETDAKTGSRKKTKNSAQARNNLTEEEKRQNHIRSEKVRRDLIKVQYDTLDELVPGLKNGKSGLSRADVLLEIVNYVENIARGNEQAEQILASWTAPDIGPSSGYG